MVGTLYGYGIESPLEFDSLRAGSGERGSLRIEPTSEELLDRWGELFWFSEQDGSQYGIANVSGGAVAWCSASGAYLLEPAAGRLQVAPRGPREPWEHRLGAVMVPLLLAGRGDLALHAATLLVGGRAVVVCGPSGRGKSTLAAALAVQGHPTASEDGTVISDLEDEPRVWPGLAGVRVTGAAVRALGQSTVPGEREEKSRRRLVDELPSSSSAALRAVVVLRARGGSELELTPLAPADALPAVMPSAIYAGPPALERTLNLVARLVERVPVYEARLPDDLTALRASAEAVVAALMRAD